MCRFYVGKYLLDCNQTKVILDNSKYLLVVAGAGSGKTLTIVGKIKYLIDYKNVNPSEILCISFTNESVNSMKEKINNQNVEVMTFHKLALNILDRNKISYSICESSYLEYVIHEFLFGIIYESNFLMKTILKYYGKYSVFCNIERSYSKLLKQNYDEICSFERLICKFIKLFKANNHTLAPFSVFLKKFLKRKDKFFILIVLNIYLIYQNELYSSGKIDFDDMITMAIKTLQNNGFIDKYKYIIIDEFQDTSYIRYLLIKTIIDKNQSKLVAVGDDFQSIYRFSGCDLKIFTEFKNYFKGANILKIENTYRNSLELINISSKFILKNPLQVRKKLLSNKSNSKPIKICYGYTLEELIMFIKGNIMILGRNNKDINKYENDSFNSHNDINIRYLTIHRSKGLEEDNVIILNVIDDNLGIPNKIEDSSILRLVLKKNEYKYAEERRLFYVALTRCRESVYLMTEKGRESVFIKELLRYKDSSIEVLKKE